MTSNIDGFNPDDPGVAMLVEASRDIPARDIVLVAMGPLAALPNAERIVLDVRELDSQARPWNVPGALAKARALVWPRAHLGKDFAQQCLARAGLSVAEGGLVQCAVRKQKGADSVEDFMADLFGNVRIAGRDRGYRLLQSVRGPKFRDEEARRVLALEYEIEDPLLGDLRLCTAPGVFSRQKLDAGTKALIEFAAEQALPRLPLRVLDVCAGVAPLGLWAARRWPSCEVYAVESSLLASTLARRNVARAGLEERVRVDARDGLPPEVPTAWDGTVDVALVNPPTHADPAELRRLLGPLVAWLGPAGRAWIVASRGEQILSAIGSLRFDATSHRVDRYSIVELRLSA